VFSHRLAQCINEVMVRTADRTIPTAVRYSSSCLAVQYGSEAIENVEGLDNATLAQGFKLFLHPMTMLQFVSEPEARIHFVISTKTIDSELHVGSTLAVCNAGDSTVETTAHVCTSAAPTFQFREITVGECVQAGSAFVDEAARQFLKRRLANSIKYGTPGAIELMATEFKRKTVGFICPHSSRISSADAGF